MDHALKPGISTQIGAFRAMQRWAERGGPLSQDLFCVAEISKQDICVPQNVREAGVPCSPASRFKGLPAP